MGVATGCGTTTSSVKKNTGVNLHPDENITATVSVAVENYAAEKQIIEGIGSVALRLQKQLPLDF